MEHGHVRARVAFGANFLTVLVTPDCPLPCNVHVPCEFSLCVCDVRWWVSVWSRLSVGKWVFCFKERVGCPLAFGLH